MDAPTTNSSTETGSGSKDGTGVGPKAIIKNVDMSEEMQQEAVDIASAALEKYNIEKDIAAQIKKEFDRRHQPTWHVVVGKNFGSYVTHGVFAFHHHPNQHCLRFFFLMLTYLRRDQTFHLFLCWIAGHPHLEVIISSSYQAYVVGMSPGAPQFCYMPQSRL
jgi:dynein light chain LC8-type